MCNFQQRLKCQAKALDLIRVRLLKGLIAYPVDKATDYLYFNKTFKR